MTDVTNNADKSRYEIVADDQLAGFAEYQLSDGMVAFTHTEVDKAFGGRGLAKILVTQALDDAKEQGLAVQPVCPYVKKVIAENADTYLELVRAEDRDKFDLPKA